MALTINRTRSPKYPNFPLGTAVRQVGKIHAADRRNVIERLNAAKHMGYSGLSGPSEKAIGTLVQYGLLELVGKGQVRVSQLAVDILHPVSDALRKAALAKAAFHPEIFKALKEQFPEGVSEASLQSYLVRQNFMDRAIAPLSKAYIETCAFLEQSGASDNLRQAAIGAPESDTPEDDGGEDQTVYGGARVGDLIQWESGGALQLEEPMRVRRVSDDGQWVAVEGSEAGIPMNQVIVEERAAAAPPRFPLGEMGTAKRAPSQRVDILSESEPYRLSLSRAGIEGTFVLTDEAEADEMIRAINAWKVLLRRVDQIQKPAGEDDARGVG